MQTANTRSMQATQGRSLGGIGVGVIRRPSTTATVMRRAPARAEGASFTIPQRLARYGLTILAIAGMAALFATQISATLR